MGTFLKLSIYWFLIRLLPQNCVWLKKSLNLDDILSQLHQFFVTDLIIISHDACHFKWHLLDDTLGWGGGGELVMDMFWCISYDSISRWRKFILLASGCFVIHFSSIHSIQFNVCVFVYLYVFMCACGCARVYCVCVCMCVSVGCVCVCLCMCV